MELDRIEHYLFDASGGDNPILKDSVIESNIFNYLIFGPKLKLRLIPKRYEKAIPDLILKIQPTTGKVNTKSECEVKTEQLSGVEVNYNPKVSEQDRILITPFYRGKQVKSFILVLTCTLVKRPVEGKFELEAGKDFLEFLMKRMGELEGLAVELEQKESVFAQLIDRAAILKEYEWAVGALKELMNELGVCISIIEDQKKNIEELTPENEKLKHELADESFIRIQDKSTFDAVIKNREKKIFELQAKLKGHEEELLKLRDSQVDLVEDQQVVRLEVKKIKTLYDEALDYLKPSTEMKIKVKQPKKPKKNKK